MVELPANSSDAHLLAYPDISKRLKGSPSSSANSCAVKVFPTPEGPANRNTPLGPFLLFFWRALFSAWKKENSNLSIASSCPMTFSLSFIPMDSVYMICCLNCCLDCCLNDASVSFPYIFWSKSGLSYGPDTFISSSRYTSFSVNSRYKSLSEWPPCLIYFFIALYVLEFVRRLLFALSSTKASYL